MAKKPTNIKKIFRDQDDYDYGTVTCGIEEIAVTKFKEETWVAKRDTPEEVCEWANDLGIESLTAALMMWNTLASKYVMIPKEKIKECHMPQELGTPETYTVVHPKKK